MTFVYLFQIFLSTAVIFCGLALMGGKFMPETLASLYQATKDGMAGYWRLVIMLTIFAPIANFLLLTPSKHLSAAIMTSGLLTAYVGGTIVMSLMIDKMELTPLRALSAIIALAGCFFMTWAFRQS